MVNFNEYIEKLKRFINDNYDMNNEKVMHKLKHTLCVINNVKYLCDKLKLNEEDTFIALLIALLHDIGRFDQAKIMSSFREDITAYNHATLGVKLLFEKNLIRYFIDNSEYDVIIKKAIENHSAYILDETNMDDREKLHSRIIRDADKLDSFRAKAVENIYTMANITEEDISNTLITDKIFDDFMNEKTILSKNRKTGIDIWISYIAFIYGLYFKESLMYIKDMNYVNKLFNRFNYTLEKKKMDILKKKAIEYIDNKIVE